MYPPLNHSTLSRVLFPFSLLVGFDERFTSFYYALKDAVCFVAHLVLFVGYGYNALQCFPDKVKANPAFFFLISCSYNIVKI